MSVAVAFQVETARFLAKYKEDSGYRADDSEPCERSENVVFHAEGLNWHAEVTFKAKIGVTGRDGLLERRKKLEALICLIDVRSAPLLPETVSEIVIEKASYMESPRLPMIQQSQLDYTDPSDTCTELSKISSSVFRTTDALFSSTQYQMDD
ncbi:kinase-like protein [Penicillium verhagenii]|nr:kinase-like protein [Penicillium verhagenii]